MDELRRHFALGQRKMTTTRVFETKLSWEENGNVFFNFQVAEMKRISSVANWQPVPPASPSTPPFEFEL